MDGCYIHQYRQILVATERCSHFECQHIIWAGRSLSISAMTSLKCRLSINVAYVKLPYTCTVASDPDATRLYFNMGDDGRERSPRELL